LAMKDLRMPNEAGVASEQTIRGLKRGGAIAAAIAALVAVGGITLRLHDISDAQDWSHARATPTVQLVEIKLPAASDSLTLPGTLQAWNAARIYARINGYMKNWFHDIGDQVAVGTALGQIETPDLDQQIGQAKADLVRAEADATLSRTTAQRWNALLSSNSVSKQETDEKNGDLASKNAAVQAAKANLGRLDAMKEFATLRAPFAGTVTLRSAEIGDFVGPNTGSSLQPLFGVADTHKIRIYVSVPQAYSAVMKPGLAATLTVPDYPGRTFSARVTGDSNAISAQTGTFQVELMADNTDGALKSGGYARVTFDVSGRLGTLMIPSSTLVFRSQGTFVATVNTDSRVHLVPIRVGRDFGSSIEVISALKNIHRVIDNPPDSIAEGEQVRVAGRG
jgi:RND family efflux transporter MFP subunit